MQVSLVSKAYDVLDVDEFTELAYEREWTDGLPVLPPTEKKVMAMLEYLARDPGECVGVIPPGEGVATIEKIVINCVMAGCKPEYVPVVIAALEAMMDERFELVRVLSTTGGPAPLAIISGPVVKRLNFNYGTGAFTGAGYRANSTIGRAIRLIVWNIGQARPGQLDQATFGHPGRYSYVVAERPRDDGNPWEEFHVTEAGLQPGDSAISMFPAGSHDQVGTGTGGLTFDNNLYMIADSICHVWHAQSALQRLLVMNPQAAQVFAEAGWSKSQVRDALLERCKRPVRDVKRTTGGLSTTIKYHWTSLVNPDDDDAMVPCMIGPQHLPILVSGGWASPGSPCVIVTSMHGEMVSRKINWDWDSGTQK
jgi:hypothetical protein